jgi:hypothetical protein
MESLGNIAEIRVNNDTLSGGVVQDWRCNSSNFSLLTGFCGTSISSVNQSFTDLILSPGNSLPNNGIRSQTNSSKFLSSSSTNNAGGVIQIMINGSPVMEVGNQSVIFTPSVKIGGGGVISPNVNSTVDFNGVVNIAKIMEGNAPSVSSITCPSGGTCTCHPSHRCTDTSGVVRYVGGFGGGTNGAAFLTITMTTSSPTGINPNCGFSPHNAAGATNYNAVYVSTTINQVTFYETAGVLGVGSTTMEWRYHCAFN